MNTKFYFLLFLLSIIGFQSHSQSSIQNSGAIPYKVEGSPLFARDILIDPNPAQNQWMTAICSAPNGWLYAAYCIDTSVSYHYKIMKSIDNGVTWFDFVNYILPENPGYIGKFSCLDLKATGKADTNINVYVGYTLHDENTYESTDYCDGKINGITGEGICNVFYRFRWDYFSPRFVYPELTSMAADTGFSSSPVLGIIVTSRYNEPNNGKCDSIFFCPSLDATVISFVTPIACSHGSLTYNRIKDISLACGKSSALATSRYFATWNDIPDDNTVNGHVFTAHSGDNIQGPFSKNICLDSIVPSDILHARKTVIASQYNNISNDSSDLTEVIVYERYIPSTKRYTLRCLYNLKATTSNDFRVSTVADSSHNLIQPDICFNPYTSEFLLTYFDSTDNKLVLVSMDMNFRNPDSWHLVTAKYNDSNNLVSPRPKISISPVKHDAIMTWSGMSAENNNQAYFDAAYIYNNGISETTGTISKSTLRAFPDPCKASTNLVFNLDKEEEANLTIYDQTGKQVFQIPVAKYNPGSNKIKVELDNLTTGIYLVRYLSSDKILSCKINHL
jgi:hypothetical protein